MTLAVSKVSVPVVPAVIVLVALLEKVCDLTIMVLLFVVTTAGATLNVEIPCAVNASTWIGLEVSTPPNDWMPPAAPLVALKVQE